MARLPSDDSGSSGGDDSGGGSQQQQQEQQERRRQREQERRIFEEAQRLDALATDAQPVPGGTTSGGSSNTGSGGGSGSDGASSGSAANRLQEAGDQTRQDVASGASQESSSSRTRGLDSLREAQDRTRRDVARGRTQSTPEDDLQRAQDSTRRDVATGSDQGTGAPAGAGGAFQLAKDITRESVATPDSQPEGGIETGPGINRISQQARDLEQQVIDETEGIDSPDQVTITRDGNTLTASLTDSGELAMTQDAQDDVQTALQGLGFEGTQDTGLRAPESGEGTKREREAEERAQTVRTGLGFEGTNESGLRAPKSGEGTLAERRRRDEVRNALEGMDPDGFGEPDPPDMDRAQDANMFPDDVTQNKLAAGYEEMAVADEVMRQRGSDPYAMLGADVDESEPSPIEFLRGDDGNVQFALFASNEQAPGERQISFTDALATQFATPDTEITDALTDSTGLFTEEREREFAESAAARSEQFGLGDEFDAAVTPVLGETAGNFARGVGTVPGELAASFDNVQLLADVGAETVENFGETAEEFGTEETLDAVGETFGAAGVGLAQEAQERPAEFAGSFAVELLAGSAALKGVEKAGDVARASRLSTTSTVDFEDITTKAGAGGALPSFDTDPDAPTAEAVEEVSERAQDNPDIVTQQTGGSTLFHGTRSDFDTSFEVGEGASELPGMFTSPEASPIALQGLGTDLSLSSLSPRLPQISGKSDRFLALPGDRVDAMPPGATGAANAVRGPDGELITGLGRGEAKAIAADDPDFEVISDPTTSGAQFLTEQADTGTAFVRPRGSRTTELEAIFAPGSGFQKVGTVGVNVGRRQFPGTDINVPLTGRQVPMDIFERAPDDADASDGDPLESLERGGTATAAALASDVSRLQTPEGSVATTGGLLGGGLGLNFDLSAPSQPSPPDGQGVSMLGDSSDVDGPSTRVPSRDGISTTASIFSGTTTTPVGSTTTSVLDSPTTGSTPSGSSPTAGRTPFDGTPTSGGPSETPGSTPGAPPSSGSPVFPTGSSTFFSGGGGSPVGGGGPPTSSPFPGEGSPFGPSRLDSSDDRSDRDEEELGGLLPVNTPFVNPIVSGQQALTGAFPGLTQGTGSMFGDLDEEGDGNGGGLFF